jgi:ADP-heptose:LPS heptosyltransferase
VYVGYDSAGQHVAAACGIPLITIFAGYPNERFFERWTPSGAGRIDVFPAERATPAELLRQIAAAISL